MKTECDYLNGWIKKTVTYAKISPKSGEPQRYSWGTQKKKKKKSKWFKCWSWTIRPRPKTVILKMKMIQTKSNWFKCSSRKIRHPPHNKNDSNAQVARRQSCANHVQHIKHLSLATCCKSLNCLNYSYLSCFGTNGLPWPWMRVIGQQKAKFRSFSPLIRVLILWCLWSLSFLN